jgi:YspA, cpYpsA-related SLOG family
MESITLAVVGSRGFADYQLFSQLLSEQLDHIRDTYSKTSGVETIVSGGACGADRLAERYAKEYGIRMRVLLPDWKKYGKRAGFLNSLGREPTCRFNPRLTEARLAFRNKEIVEECDVLIAFWDGSSKGTQHSINEAKKQKKPTTVITC